MASEKEIVREYESVFNDYQAKAEAMWEAMRMSFAARWHLSEEEMQQIEEQA